MKKYHNSATPWGSKEQRSGTKWATHRDQGPRRNQKYTGPDQKCVWPDRTGPDGKCAGLDRTRSALELGANRKCIWPDRNCNRTALTGSASDRTRCALNDNESAPDQKCTNPKRKCTKSGSYSFRSKARKYGSLHQHGGIKCIEYQILHQYQLPTRALYTFRGMSLFQ